MYQIDFQNPASVYFVGIGGISMSGLAEVLHDAGFAVSGSDRDESDLTRHLEELGIRVHIPQRAENITPELDLVVFTAAIHEDNPEYVRTKELGLPSLTRAELVGELMQNYRTSIAVSGTHGKTTTTSMVSEILLAADTDPTISVGGMLPSIGGNIRVGGRDFFVAEACEYTNSFLSFLPTIGVILNVEEDHMDFFEDLADIRNSFHRFALLLPEDGALVISADIPDFQELTEGARCKIITFGSRKTDAPEAAGKVSSPDAGDAAGIPDYYADDILYEENGCASFTARTPAGALRISLAVPGAHNIQNALAALAAADAAGIPRDFSARGLSGFQGTQRRFERKGSFGGVTLIDDYAHHPAEIRATLHAAKRLPHRRLWVVFQPHTYSRTIAFLDDFADALSLADKIVLADIYAAREADTGEVSSGTLQEKLLERGSDCTYLPSFEAIEKFLLENCIRDDLLITMGAGDVYKIGDALLGR